MTTKRVVITCAIVSLVLLSLFLPQAHSIMAATSITGLHVSGNQILNGSNQSIRFLGINKSGAEYSCVQGKGIFDSPVDATAVAAMVTWKIDAVRIPMNEDCWLAINGVNSAYAGSNYQTAIVNFVNLLNSNGIIAILDLHWGAPGSTLATAQTPMPDADHSPAFWSSVANTFKSNSSVIFDLFNEPFPDNNSDTTAGWTCWRDGGSCSGVSYTAAGMQSLVTTVRNTGATNIIMLGGLQYSNALSHWLTYKPSDPSNNLVASWHVYNFNVCSNSSCWDTNAAPVAQQVPLVAGEIGENDCAHGFVDSLMGWLDSHNSSYLGWTWNTWDCSSGPSLISDYNGTATNYGLGLKNHLANIGPSVTNTPTRTSTRTNTPTRTATGSTPTFTHTPTRTNTPTRTATGPTPTFTRTPTRTQTPPPGSGTCTVTYTIQNDWGSGFTANIVIANNSGTAINGWTLTWNFPGNQTVTNLWNGTYTQSGVSVSVKNLSYNATIGANGGTVNFGFNANYSGTNTRPPSFTLNGTTCQ